MFSYPIHTCKFSQPADGVLPARWPTIDRTKDLIEDADLGDGGKLRRVSSKRSCCSVSSFWRVSSIEIFSFCLKSSFGARLIASLCINPYDPNFGSAIMHQHKNALDVGSLSGRHGSETTRLRGCADLMTLERGSVSTSRLSAVISGELLKLMENLRPISKFRGA